MLKSDQSESRTARELLKHNMKARRWWPPSFDFGRNLSPRRKACACCRDAVILILCRPKFYALSSAGVPHYQTCQFPLHLGSHSCTEFILPPSSVLADNRELVCFRYVSSEISQSCGDWISCKGLMLVVGEQVESSQRPFAVLVETTYRALADLFSPAMRLVSTDEREWGKKVVVPAQLSHRPRAERVFQTRRKCHAPFARRSKISSPIYVPILQRYPRATCRTAAFSFLSCYSFTISFYHLEAP